MRKICWLIFLTMVSSLWAKALGQQPLALPVVRGAYAATRPEGKVLDKARLRNYVALVSCKKEFDPWIAAHPNIKLSLYVDGRAATPEAPPTLSTNLRQGETQESLKAICAPEELQSAQTSDAEASKATEKVKADQANPKPDANQLAADQKDENDKITAAKAARIKADQAGATVVLYYYLDEDNVITDSTKAVWIQLLQRPWQTGDILVTTGPAAGPPWPSAITIGFDRINWVGLIIWGVLYVFFIVLFVISAKKTDIIRDSGTLPAGTPPNTQKSFSLGRTQMALWTFLVGGAFMFIFLVTWNANTITPGVLGLIGISAGTTLLSAVADGVPAPQPTNGFFRDLLSDGTGESFHRYQMILFTAILAVVFVIKVGNGLVMPEFDPTLLGLMGISNGTYLGFKLQGK